MALTGPHVVVVLVLVVVALLLACWWLVRTTPTAISTTPVAQVSASPVEPDLVETQPSSDPTGAAGDTASAAGAVPEVTVDVAGKVRDPGIVVLPAGSRVIDALEAAGGARSSVDLSVLNLARPLVDGEQVLVGAPAAVTAPGAPAGVPGGAATPLVDLNTADQALLETLPGVGPVTAAAILAWRTEHGRFTVVEELLEVDGIGPATLEDLAPLVQVHP